MIAVCCLQRIKVVKFSSVLRREDEPTAQDCKIEHCEIFLQLKNKMLIPLFHQNALPACCCVDDDAPPHVIRRELRAWALRGYYVHTDARYQPSKRARRQRLACDAVQRTLQQARRCDLLAPNDACAPPVHCTGDMAAAAVATEAPFAAVNVKNGDAAIAEVAHVVATLSAAAFASPSDCEQMSRTADNAGVEDCAVAGLMSLQCSAFVLPASAENVDNVRHPECTVGAKRPRMHAQKHVLKKQTPSAAASVTLRYNASNAVAANEQNNVDANVREPRVRRRSARAARRLPARYRQR